MSFMTTPRNNEKQFLRGVVHVVLDDAQKQ